MKILFFLILLYFNNLGTILNANQFDFKIGKEEKEFKKPKLYRFWNFLIYGSSIAIGVFLVYLYSAYVFINK